MARIGAWMAAAPAAAAFVLACGSGGGAAERNRGGAERVVTGTVTRASGAEIAVRGAGDRPLTLRIDAQTRVTLDGRRATPSEIAEGAEVRASYRGDPSDSPVAVRVDANSGTSGATRGYGSAGAQHGKPSGIDRPARNGATNGAHGGQGSAPAGDTGPGPRERPRAR